jgi:type I restriction-modification system DNA methylase subunit
MTTTFQQSLDEIARLVKQFSTNRAYYLAPGYKEADVRQEFIDPLFNALGWDVHNTQGAAPYYREVIFEESVGVEGEQRTPDYVFRVGRERKFFAEAKKPGVSIKTDFSPAYQLRSYAWSAKLPLSILTDFEEFAVYDCRSKPSHKDQASSGRVSFYDFDQYLDLWRGIWDVFSRPAVLGGSFDQFVESEKARRGTNAVDDEFLKEIETWRTTLARNIALRNPRISIGDLNDAVQRTIDRIIFLRMAEDRGTETWGQLRKAGEGPDIYSRLVSLYDEADGKYNSGLFDFSARGDSLTRKLKIDDGVLKSVIGDLYFPQSPYQFNLLPLDILGQVYEQFLGKVIHLTPSHQARVEEKPEVKKAGGVVYTPAFIVDYLVTNTIGKLVAGKTPKEISRLRILDIGCGSGSFLLGAYGYLLDWHLRWYSEHEPEKLKKELYLTSEGYRLTTAEKKRILLNNIYGVDIDRQAVEVTKLSLLLKVLEGENEETLGKQLSLFKERALPNLDQNIKCGNSLIGPDYFENRLIPDEAELQRINPFDWQQEFPAVMKAGGFDCVIGNPPYVRSQLLGEGQRVYYGQNFRTATATYDIYVLFVERALSLINKDGRVGFILPNKFFTTDYGSGLRELLTTPNLIDRIVDFEDGQVFARAGTYTALIFVSKKTTSPQYARLGAVYREKGSRGLAKILGADEVKFEPLSIAKGSDRWTLAVGQSGNLLLRLQKDYPALSILEPHIFQGLKTSADKVYMVSIKRTKGDLCEVETGLGQTTNIERAILRPVVKGEHVQRYSIDMSASLYIIYPYEVRDNGRAVILDQRTIANRFPYTWDYLKANKKVLGARDRGIWDNRSDWYAYARSQNIATFVGEKLLIPYMTTRLRVAPDFDGQLFFVNITTGGYGLRINYGQYHSHYLIGLLNSRLLDQAIQQMTNTFRGGYFAVNKQGVERLPFRPINFSDPIDKAYHDRMVSLVGQMLQLHQHLNIAQSNAERKLYQRQINSTDGKIDNLVYELYGLTEEEIKIVEGEE